MKTISRLCCYKGNANYNFFAMNKTIILFVGAILASGLLLLNSCADSGAPAANAAGQESAETTETAAAGSVHEFKMKTIDGKEKSLADYKGKVLVLLNVASKCGYTPQYEDWQKFYESHKGKDVEVLGFPANNFMGQEPGSDAEIKEFCTSEFNVSFPMFSKISVKGKDQHPLYAYLTKTTGEKVSWNFNKYLVDQNGKVVAHYKSGVKPDDEDFKKKLNELL